MINILLIFFTIFSREKKYLLFIISPFNQMVQGLIFFSKTFGFSMNEMDENGFGKLFQVDVLGRNRFSKNWQSSPCEKGNNFPGRKGLSCPREQLPPGREEGVKFP